MGHLFPQWLSQVVMTGAQTGYPQMEEPSLWSRSQSDLLSSYTYIWLAIETGEKYVQILTKINPSAWLDFSSVKFTLHFYKMYCVDFKIFFMDEEKQQKSTQIKFNYLYVSWPTHVVAQIHYG